MAINYTWKIMGVELQSANNLTNVVTKIKWIRFGVDDADNISGAHPGVTNFSAGEIDPANFTFYEQLNETQVIAWIESKENIAEINQFIDNEINKSRSVKSVSRVEIPWISQI